MRLFVQLSIIVTVASLAAAASNPQGCKTSQEIDCCVYHNEVLGCQDVSGNQWQCVPRGGLNQPFWQEVSATSGWSESTYNSLPTYTKRCTGDKVTGCGTYEAKRTWSQQKVNKTCESKPKPTDPEDC